MIGFPSKTDPKAKGELVSCLDCEKGFRYGKREIEDFANKMNGS